MLFGAYNPSGRLPVTFYYENYTSQILMTDMNMRPFPGRTHKYLQVRGHHAALWRRAAPQ